MTVFSSIKIKSKIETEVFREIQKSNLVYYSIISLTVVNIITNKIKLDVTRKLIRITFMKIYILLDSHLTRMLATNEQNAEDEQVCSVNLGLIDHHHLRGAKLTKSSTSELKIIEYFKLKSVEHSLSSCSAGISFVVHKIEPVVTKK